MPSYFDSYFGEQALADPSVGAATLKITDGMLSVIFTTSFETDTLGWSLLASSWKMNGSRFKSGGFYLDSMTADGSFLKDAYFGNVTESFQVLLHFRTADGMQEQIDTLEELLKVRAVRYWKEPRYHSPVWIEKALPGESGIVYALVNQGAVSLPGSLWCVQETFLSGILSPVQVTVDRQPLWLSAQPGEEQDVVEISAEQDWDYDVSWSVEDALPVGYTYAFQEMDNGDIYAAATGQILYWNGAAWAVQNTAPVAVTACRCVLLLNNGDLLFGDDGQIVKRSAAGTWSQETALPSSHISSMVQARDGLIYAGGDGEILKRESGSWSVDTTLPSSDVWAMLQAEEVDERIYAGGDEILATVKSEISGEEEEVEVQIASVADQAEQYGAIVYTNPTPSDEIALFNGNYVGLRFQLDVPVGAVINEAELEFYQKTTASGNSPPAKVYCEAVDDAAAFTDADNDVSDRTLTDVFMTWQDTKTRRKGRSWEEEGFEGPLQEVVDRPGWAADQHVVIIIKADDLCAGLVGCAEDGRREVYGYDENPAKAPVLEVEYTLAAEANEGWEVVATSPINSKVWSLAEADNLLLAGDTGNIISSDDGDTWGVVSTLPTSNVQAIYDDPLTDNVWAGDNGRILLSIDRGRNWAVYDDSIPTNFVISFVVETATGILRAGDNGNILALDTEDTVTLGRDETAEDEVMIANHNKVANVTHIYVADGAVFGSNLFPNDYDVAIITLLPAVPLVNDALYVGIDTSLGDTGPFTGVVWDILQHAVSTTSYAINIEYWDGNSWETLTTHDETSQFSEPGVYGVFWEPPSDWATKEVNGVTGYWVRWRVSARTGTITPPTQQNRDPYSPIWSHVEIAADQVAGTVMALARLHVRSRADEGGPGGQVLFLYSNRIIAGLKRTEGHDTFQSFINFADEQNPTGISVDVGVDPDSATSIVTDIDAPTARSVFFDAGIADGGNGLDNFEDRVSVDVDTTTARDWYGVYKAFLRIYQGGGSPGEVEFRLKIVSGSGGVSFVTEIQRTASVEDHELIEFEAPIMIPVSAQFDADEIGDQTSIVVQISAVEADADCYLYDLVLIPTDVAWIDAEDRANTAESSVEDGRRLSMGRIRVPKAPTRALVEKMVDDTKVSSWRVAGNGPLLLNGEEHRLHFLHAKTDGVGVDLWISKPETASSVTLGKVERWTFGRGDN